MANFKRVPLVIDAIRLNHTLLDRLHVPQGCAGFEVGDWLISGIGGEQYVVPHERFKELYEPADAAAEEYYLKVTTE